MQSVLNSNLAYCKLCKSEHQPEVTTLKRHASSAGHKSFAASQANVPSIKSVFEAAKTALRSQEEKVKVCIYFWQIYFMILSKRANYFVFTEAELKLSVFVSVHCAIRTIDELSELTKELFRKVSPVADKLAIHRTKCSV